VQADFTLSVAAFTVSTFNAPQDSLTSLDAPVMGGSMVYTANVRLGTNNPQAIYAGSNRVVRTGIPEPGGLPGTFDGFRAGYFTNRSGSVAFSASVNGVDGMWIHQGGEIKYIASDGSAAPGTNGQFNLLPNAPIDGFNDQGKVAFCALVEGAPAGFRQGLWMGPAGALGLLAREGSPAPDSPPGTVYQSLSSPLINSDGAAAFYATTSQPRPPEFGGFLTTVLFTGQPGAVRAVVRTGDMAPGTESGVFFDLRHGPMGFNSAGTVAFLSNLDSLTLYPGGPGVAIYSGTRGHLRLVARTGSPAPGTEAGTVFKSLRSPALNEAGEVSFWAQAGVPGGVATDGIWTGRPGQLRLIARVGSEAPGTGLSFEYLYPMALSDSGQVLFSSSLLNAPIGEGSALYATDERGGLRLLAQSGKGVLGSQPINLYDAYYSQTHVAGNSDGRRVAINSNGVAAFLTQWTGTESGLPGVTGRWAIITATPATSPPVIPVEGQPADVMGIPGGNAELQVTALGTRPATYQWKFKGTPLPEATGPVLALENLGAAARGSYTVVVTNARGSVESAPAVVKLPPLITTQPGSLAVAAGASPIFSVEALDYGSALTYAWAWQAPGAPDYTTLGVTTPQLSLPGVTTGQAGKYRVTVSNSDGAATSNPVMLTVAPAGQVVIERLTFKGDRASAFAGDVYFSSPEIPVLNNAGEVIFQSNLEDANGTVIQLAPYIFGKKSAAYQMYLQYGYNFSLNDGGTASMASSNITFVERNNNGVLMGPPGNVRVLAQEGSPASGTEDTFADSNGGVALNARGVAAFRQGINNTTTHVALYMGTPDGVVPLLTAGRQAPGQPAGVTVNNMELQVVLNNAGTAAVLAILTGPGITDANDEGIWTVNASGAQRLFAEGEGVFGQEVGTNFGSWSLGRNKLLRINDAGQVAFSNRFQGPAVTSLNNEAVLVGTPADLRVVARKGDSAEGHTFLGLALVDRPVVVNNAGQVLFAAYVDPVGGVEEYLESLWRWTPGTGAGAGMLKMIARQGLPAAGLPTGVIYGSSDFGVPLFGFAMNRAGQIVLRSWLAGPGVNQANHNNGGWWITTAAGDPRLVARTGDAFDTGEGNMQTLWDINLGLYLGSGGADGLARVLSDTGEFVFAAGLGTFGNTMGVFRATIPGTVTAPPFAITRTAENVTSGSATLTGIMNPADAGSSFYFLYGPSTNYGQQTPVQTLTAGDPHRLLSANITGLAGNTTYHFKLVANNNTGAGMGYDQTFTTPKSVEALAYEVWAAAAGLTGADALPMADPDGDGVVNFMEYALKTDPLKPTVLNATDSILNLAFISINYRVWFDVVAAGVNYQPELISDGLLQTSGFTDEEDPDAQVIPGSSARRVLIPIDPAKKSQFLRLRVSKP